MVCILGVAKKLEQLAKQKDCEVVHQWVKSISNHLYWSAASSDNGDVMVAKWKSIGNHLQDIHEGHGELFPVCLHPQLEVNRKWLKPR